MNDELLSVVRSQLSKIRIPTTYDKVYKDECVVSFDNSFSDDGIYVNLVTWLGYGKAYFLADSVRSGSLLYFHQKWTQIPKPKETEKANDGPQKLGIGVSGGFQLEAEFDIVKDYELVIVNRDGSTVAVPIDDPLLPEYLINVLDAIINHAGMKTMMAVSTWDADNEKIVSKYAADLIQLDNAKKISNDLATWKCEMSGDTSNLWLNLSTGYIGGGRKNWDGSGGSGAALMHFEETGGIYPLCVKLGTITPHGADVWSYAPDEDCLVIDPLLPQHLAHWGINIMTMTKTDKSMSELEVDLNLSYDWSKILESGEELEVISRPGFVGLRNIGSSCYMNSVLQTLFVVPEVIDRYFRHRDRILSSFTAKDPTQDFPVQMSKLGHALLTTAYLPPASSLVDGALMNMPTGEDGNSSLLEKYVIAPRMFKQLVAKNHAEFSSGRQQDAYEYFLYLLDTMARAERTSLARLVDEGVDSSSIPNTASFFEFYFETRLQCMTTNQVKYSSPSRQSMVNTWDLRIPLDRAINTAEVNEHAAKKARLEGDAKLPSATDDVKLIIPFHELLNTFFAEEIIEYTNPAVGHPAPTIKTVKFQSYPKYLMIKLGRYYVDATWKQIKIDACVPMPEFLDLSAYRGHGIQANEQSMPSSDQSNAAALTSTTTAAATEASVQPDEGIVLQLMAMGFSENGSKKAALATGNADADAAMNWVFAHMEDPDFNDPPAAVPAATTSTSAGNTSSAVNAESVMMLSSMGYTEEQAKAALTATNNDIERAADWLFSHTDDLDSAVREAMSASKSASQAPTSSDATVISNDGKGEYELIAIVSHIGRNTDHGHYVSHIKKDGVWAIFNDEKVAKSKSPPLDQGYMYLYRRRVV
jgi:ubiquitin carboxyl-terminal hydrolase 5/13